LRGGHPSAFRRWRHGGGKGVRDISEAKRYGKRAYQGRQKSLPECSKLDHTASDWAPGGYEKGGEERLGN